jgi:hypothetical protein
MVPRLLFAVLCIGVLSTACLAGPAGIGSPGAQSVQEHGKADNLLISELPTLVRKLTDECLIEERASSDRALSCWDQAAQALDRYVGNLRGPLIEQVRRLQAMWRQRVADLESRRRAVALRRTAIVRPASARFNQSDPDRFPGTPSCSSNENGACESATDESTSASLGNDEPIESAAPRKPTKQKTAVKKRLRREAQKGEPPRQKKRVAKREATQKAALEAAAEEKLPPEPAWKSRSKRLKCFFTGCPPNS